MALAGHDGGDLVGVPGAGCAETVVSTWGWVPRRLCGSCERPAMSSSKEVMESRLRCGRCTVTHVSRFAGGIQPDRVVLPHTNEAPRLDPPTNRRTSTRLMTSFDEIIADRSTLNTAVLHGHRRGHHRRGRRRRPMTRRSRYLRVSDAEPSMWTVSCRTDAAQRSGVDLQLHRQPAQRLMSSTAGDPQPSCGSSATSPAWGVLVEYLDGHGGIWGCSLPGARPQATASLGGHLS